MIDAQLTFGWPTGQTAAPEQSTLRSLLGYGMMLSALRLRTLQWYGHLRTQEQCNERNLEFLPFIIEADGGGLGSVARKVCATVAQAWAARDGEEVSCRAASLLRRITTTVHRENARALLRRLPLQTAVPVSSSPAAWGADEFMDIS